MIHFERQKNQVNKLFEVFNLYFYTYFHTLAALKRGFKGTNTPDQPTQNSNEIIENTNQPKNEIKDKRKLKKKIQEPSLSFSESKIVNHA